MLQKTIFLDLMRVSAFVNTSGVFAEAPGVRKRNSPTNRHTQPVPNLPIARYFNPYTVTNKTKHARGGPGKHPGFNLQTTNIKHRFFPVLAMFQSLIGNLQTQPNKSAIPNHPSFNTS